MREVDPLISEFSHEKHRPRETEALLALRKIASLVKPIMRARNWRVGTLSEFYPQQTNLLGMNVNHGQKILLRLRYPGDANQFLPLEQVVDTMLHELSHIVFGPHNADFHALWDQLRDEYQGLMLKGYTGEGFLSEGKMLGGRAVPRDEARRIARIAAEKRRNLGKGSGQKLGGAPVPVGTDMRKKIADTAERRATIMKGCGSGDSKTDKEVEEISKEAYNNGFRTKAEEDKANEAAIAQALWELGQDEEKDKYGESYISPSAANPVGNNAKSGAGNFPGPSRAPVAPVAAQIAPSIKKQVPTRPGYDRPLSRLVQQTSKPSRVPSVSSNRTSTAPIDESIWACPQCTFNNPFQFLACDVCGGQRPATAVKANSPPRIPVASKPKLKTWTCYKCTTIVDDEWWTCSTCGTMKASS